MQSGPGAASISQEVRRRGDGRVEPHCPTTAACPPWRWPLPPGAP